MRWERLFADLEGQLDAADAGELAAEVADRTRHEVGRVRLVDRLRAACDLEVRFAVLGGAAVTGRVVAVGADWALVAEPGGREALVPLRAVLSIAGLLPRAAHPGSEGSVAARFDLRLALRGLVRDRAAVAVTLVDAARIGGTLDRVGADFVELAEHAAGEPRRAAAVRTLHTVSLAGLAVVRSR